MLTRQEMYGLGYRPAMIQWIELGATAAGTLEAITHDAITVTSQYEDFYRQETGWSGLLYKCAHAKYTHKLARLDLATSCDMRAPSAATGVYALECAMDELAVALKLDPLELRLRCYSDRDQTTDRPYSSKALRECYRQGAEAFGWDKRNPEPRSMRDGNELVGWGMATGIWKALQVPIAVRIVLTANGHAEVSCATSDIGTGTYTIMAQVAADRLGLPLDSITIKLGDSTLPQSPVEGGSFTAASVSNGIATTSDAIRNELLSLAKQIPIQSRLQRLGISPRVGQLLRKIAADLRAACEQGHGHSGSGERPRQCRAVAFPNADHGLRRAVQADCAHRCASVGRGGARQQAGVGFQAPWRRCQGDHLPKRGEVPLRAAGRYPDRRLDQVPRAVAGQGRALDHTHERGADDRGTAGARLISRNKRRSIRHRKPAGSVARANPSRTIDSIPFFDSPWLTSRALAIAPPAACVHERLIARTSRVAPFL